ncbi:MAG: transposase, partial [Ignavibacteriae bacterium]|nr:transposase [Ignavibacteriota bacterium]
QRSFYDRIIRNETELFNIRKYIEQNPLKWDLENELENLY